MYLANHYVKVGRKVYRKGEAIPANIPEEKLAWLLEAGAVKECTVSGDVKEDPAPEIAGEPEEDAGITEEVQPEDAEEADEDAEAPEIDVMAGIVQDEPEDPKKPARARSTKGKGKTK